MKIIKYLYQKRRKNDIAKFIQIIENTLFVYLSS